MGLGLNRKRIEVSFVCAMCDWVLKLNHSTCGAAAASAEAGALVCGFSSAFGAGPVCVIGTTRSVFGGGVGLRGAVTVNTPSEDNEDCTSFGLIPAGNWYRRVN